MRINAIIVVKDNVDIVEEALLYAMKFCHKIYIYDNHSTDGSWELVNEMAARFRELVIFGQTDESVGNALLSRIYNRFHSEYTNEDWWYVLKSDELLSESPKEQLTNAFLANKNAMKVWLARFYLTNQEVTDFGNEDVTTSITKRRKYYSVNKSEPRFFLNDPERKWSETESTVVPNWANSPSRDFVVSRCFPMRSPQQIEQNGGTCVPSGEYPCASTLNEYHNDGDFNIPRRARLYAFLAQVEQCVVKKFCGRSLAPCTSVNSRNALQKSL